MLARPPLIVCLLLLASLAAGCASEPNAPPPPSVGQPDAASPTATATPPASPSENAPKAATSPPPTPTTPPATPETRPPTTKTFTGSSDAATEIFHLPNGLSQWNWTHDGSGHFAVKLLHKDGTWADLLANDIGAFQGSKWLSENAGDYLLEVDADSDWTVTLTLHHTLSPAARAPATL